MVAESWAQTVTPLQNCIQTCILFGDMAGSGQSHSPAVACKSTHVGTESHTLSAAQNTHWSISSLCFFLKPTGVPAFQFASVVLFTLSRSHELGAKDPGRLSFPFFIVFCCFGCFININFSFGCFLVFKDLLSILP